MQKVSPRCWNPRAIRIFPKLALDKFPKLAPLGSKGRCPLLTVKAVGPSQKGFTPLLCIAMANSHLRLRISNSRVAEVATDHRIYHLLTTHRGFPHRALWLRRVRHMRTARSTPYPRKQVRLDCKQRRNVRQMYTTTPMHTGSQIDLALIGSLISLPRPIPLARAMLVNASCRNAMTAGTTLHARHRRKRMFSLMVRPMSRSPYMQIILPVNQMLDRPSIARRI